jgi:hypothetical protein
MESFDCEFYTFNIRNFHRQNPSTHLELRLVTRTTPFQLTLYVGLAKS